jgi:di/tricarboxylate transporter
MSVLAVWRESSRLDEGLADLKLRFGDALLLQGPRDRLPVLRTESDLIVLADEERRPPLRKKAWLAGLILAVALTSAALKPAAAGEILMAGALAMALVGIVTMDQAYSAIDWRTVFLVAGMLPTGLAMTKTGAATLLADGLVRVVGSAGVHGLLAALFLVTALLTQAVNGAAVAAILTPVAIQSARHVDGDPRAFAMAVALATSMAFVTPLGHPVNLLVMGQGGYRFRDYARVGLPLAILLFAVVIVLLPLVWPLRPP